MCVVGGEGEGEGRVRQERIKKEEQKCALGDVAVHLVDADDELLHAEQVDQERVLARLALDLTGLVVALGDGGREVA